MTVLRALRRKPVWTIVSAQLLSAIGNYFYSVAVIWFAVRTSGSGAGLVAASGAIAVICFGLMGGICADRWNRRWTMITVDLTRALLILGIPVLWVVGELRTWQLIVLSFLVNALGTLFDPCLQASLGPLVDEDGDLLRAMNALVDITRRLGRLIGPALAALLLLWVPIIHLFTLDAVSFAISAASIVVIGGRYAWSAHPEPSSGSHKAGVVAQVWSGVGVIARTPGLRVGMVSAMFSNFTWGVSWTVGVPLLVARSLDQGPSTFALIVAAYGAGNVASNLVLGNVRVQGVSVILWGRIVVGTGIVLLALSPGLPFALMASFIAALGGPAGDLTTNLMIQRLPRRQIGTVFGAFSTFQNSANSLGLLLAVPVLALLPIRLGVGAGALPLIASCVIGIGLVQFRAIRRRPPRPSADI